MYCSGCRKQRRRSPLPAKHWRTGGRATNGSRRGDLDQRRASLRMMQFFLPSVVQRKLLESSRRCIRRVVLSRCPDITYVGTEHKQQCSVCGWHPQHPVRARIHCLPVAVPPHPARPVTCLHSTQFTPAFDISSVQDEGHSINYHWHLHFCGCFLSTILKHSRRSGELRLDLSEC